MEKSWCKKLKNRIRRIKGQVEGVEKMIDNGRDVQDIITQISAARAALGSLAGDVLREESLTCLEEKSVKEQKKKFETLVTSFFKVT